MIWSAPVGDVANRLSISPDQLRKACRDANIPRPDRIYWNSVKRGQKGKQPPLPERQLGQAEHVTLRDESRMVSGAKRRMLLDGPPPMTPDFPDALGAVELRARALAAAAPSSRKTLSSRHSAISKLLMKDEENMRRWRGSALDADFYPVISSTKQGRRRLLILNQLLQALAYCGARFAKTKEYAYVWSIQIWDVQLSFELRDINGPSNAMERRHKERDGTSDLELVISERPIHGIKTEWRDSKLSTLEAQMGEIVAGFLVAAEFSYRHRENCRVERLQREKLELNDTIQRHGQERLQEELARWKRAEQERQEYLLQEVAEWKKAEEIRSFVDARLQAAKDGTSEEKDLSERWSTWALMVADSIDPIARHDDEPG